MYPVFLAISREGSIRSSGFLFFFFFGPTPFVLQLFRRIISNFKCIESVCKSDEVASQPFRRVPIMWLCVYVAVHSSPKAEDPGEAHARGWQGSRGLPRLSQPWECLPRWALLTLEIFKASRGDPGLVAIARPSGPREGFPGIPCPL
jgi:hypothetical protein